MLEVVLSTLDVRDVFDVPDPPDALAKLMRQCEAHNRHTTHSDLHQDTVRSGELSERQVLGGRGHLGPLGTSRPPEDILVPLV